MSIDPRETALDDEMAVHVVNLEQAEAAVEASIERMFGDPGPHGAAKAEHIAAHDKAKDEVARIQQEIGKVEERKALLAKFKDRERRLQLAKFDEAQIRKAEDIGNECVAMATAMAPHLEKVIEGYTFIKKQMPLMYRCQLLPRGQSMGEGIPDIKRAMGVELYRQSLELYNTDPLKLAEPCFPGSETLPFKPFGSPHDITPMADVLRDHVKFLIDYARGKIDAPVPIDVLSQVDEG